MKQDNEQAKATFDSARFRQVLGHFPTGVTVITTVSKGTPIGLTIGSFTSVSLDPPLVMFCVDKSSTSWAKIEQSGTFCVNILSDEQEQMSRVFASRAADKFSRVHWRASPTGSPLIDGTLAWIDCQVEAVHAAGDHLIVIGRVCDIDATDRGGPLLFFKGSYCRIDLKPGDSEG